MNHQHSSAQIRGLSFCGSGFLMTAMTAMSAITRDLPDSV